MLNSTELKDLVTVMGYEDACEYIKAEAEKAINAAVEEQAKKTRQECWSLREWWGNVSGNIGMGLIFGGIAAGLVWGPIWLGLNDKAEHAAQLTACSQGRTIPCTAAVQEQDYNEDKDRAKLLRLAYKLTTGKPLPETDEGG